MRQVATGIQTTGTPHLGNVVGGILPAIAAGRRSEKPPVYIVADMHSMLSVTGAKERRDNMLKVSAAWMALGAENGLMYRQSQIPDLSQIALLLAGSASMEAVMEGTLKPLAFSNIHPVLMTADLLMMDTTHIPVGPDSLRHIEIVQDTARRFNAIYGEVFIVPEGLFQERGTILPGTDGRKMSKSYGNCIDVLGEPDAIRSAIAAIEEPRGSGSIPPWGDDGVIPRLFQAVCGGAEADDATSRIPRAGTTHERAKSMLTDLLVEKFRMERYTYRKLLEDPGHLRANLRYGEDKVREIARLTVERAKLAMGMDR